MSVESQIFGLAATAAYIAGTNLGIVNVSGMLQQMAVSFGGQTGDGTYVYNMFTGTSGLMTTSGFDSNSSAWQNLVGAVANYDNYAPSYIGISSLIYALSTFSNLNSQYQTYYVNTYSTNIHAPSAAPFTFTMPIVSSLMNDFSLTQLNQTIATSPANVYNKMINYNWYDSTPLFGGVTFTPQLIKDVENQYYYLTGEMMYGGLPSGLSPCSTQIINITTPTGVMQSIFITNAPCYDSDSYIGPISGIKFARVFNDGPTTSGYFDAATQAEYVAFDEAVLAQEDYSSNSVILYSYDQDALGNYILLFSGINVDVPGVYDPDAEYGYGSSNLITSDTSNGCGWGNPPSYVDMSGNPLPYMNMHQGGNDLKWWFNKYCPSPNGMGGCSVPCVVETGLYPWTGWKLVDFELDSVLAPQFYFINTNPQANYPRMLKRVLNLDASSPYAGVGDTGDGILTCTGYVGPPQLNGISQLPGFVFYQTFENQDFPVSGTHHGVFASIVGRPVVSTSTAGATYSSSNRQFSTANISHFNAFSGIYNHFSSLSSNLSVPIFATYDSTQMSGYDDIFQQCLSIGDGFGGTVSFTTGLESNAGFTYTGYSYTMSGVPIELADLLDTYNIITLGSNYRTVKYITGYNNSGGFYTVLPQVAQIETGINVSGFTATGKKIDYYYFNTDALIGAVNAGWSNFAPIPSDVVANPNNYTGAYGIQQVENYIPRYQTGPFVTYNNTFLYPNAQAVASVYTSQASGFPTGFQYAMSVKEETVREVYCLSGFNNYIVPLQIIRASGTNAFNLNTTMVTPFVANNTSYTNIYDFNKNPSLYPTVGSFGYYARSTDYMVNENYVPNTDGCFPLSLNSMTCFNNASAVGAFQCGVRSTGQPTTRLIYTGVSGESMNIYNTTPFVDYVYWAYVGSQQSGQCLYAPPLFDLSSGGLNVTQNLTKDIYTNLINRLGNQDSAFSNDGSLRYISILDQNGNYDGKDPIYYQNIGGRVGGNAVAEGGCNSKGIVGDSWYNFNAQTWGLAAYFCPAIGYTFRYPLNDSDFTLLSLHSGGLTIYTKSLQYNPYYLDWKYTPYRNSLPNIGILVTPVRFGSEYYFNFNLKNAFPLKSVNSGSWYYPSGLILGPFPMDSELCITQGNQIIPSGDLYIDQEMLATSNTSLLNIGERSACLGTYVIGSGFMVNAVDGFVLNTGVILGQNGRSSVLSTFKLIPSGTSISINISGTGNLGLIGDAIVTLRPRTVFAATDINYGTVDTTILSGDIGMMSNFNHINNGSEATYEIPNNGRFENLIGQQFVFETKPKTEVLFPIPGSDFLSILSGARLITSDTFGNLTFDTTQGGPTHQYWKIKTPNTLYTGFREVSRVSFEITQITPLYGPFPYQTYKVMIPSGTCTISGAFGYSGEAESAVITKGIVLSGALYPSAMSGILEPIYVSDVLWGMIPTGITTLPSGSGIYPVLSAPSYVQVRQNYPVITGGDTYVPLTPIGTNYNRFLWPALSDFATLNPTLSYETLPPDDGNVFFTDNLIFSACMGQQVISGVFNPIENVTYQVIEEFTLLNSTATNSLYNAGSCILQTLPSPSFMDSGNLTGLLAPEGTSVALAVALL